MSRKCCLNYSFLLFCSPGPSPVRPHDQAVQRGSALHSAQQPAELPTSVDIYIYIYIYKYMCIYIYIYIHRYIDTYIHRYIQTHTHTHTRVSLFAPSLAQAFLSMQHCCQFKENRLFHSIGSTPSFTKPDLTSKKSQTKTHPAAHFVDLSVTLWI